jgi:hypothetical protein
MMDILASFFLLISVVSAGYNNNQLPQLINADGSLTAHHDQQPINSNGYANYYPQNQQPYQQAGNFFSQAGNELKQGAQNFGNQMQNAGEALGNAPRNFVNGVQDLGSQLSQGFDNMVQSGLNKLNDLKGQFAEKFRPLLDNAIQIFQTPRTEKEKWNEVSSLV